MNTPQGRGSRLIAGTVWCCALLAAWPAAAEPLTLAQALDAAWQRTQAGAPAMAQALRAQAQRQAADSLLAAPPALELSQRQDRWQSNTGVQEREVGVALPLWLPGQRSARQAAAQADVTLAALSSSSARLRLAGELRELGWSVAGLRAEARAAQAQLAYLQALSEDVQRRVRSGDLARSDALAAQGERLAAAAQALEVNQRLQAERQRLASLTGQATELEPAEPADLPAAEALLEGDAHPTLALAAQTVEAARRQVELARLDRAEAPELSIGYRSERSERGQPSQGSMTLALRLPLGTAVRNAPLRGAAQAALDQALAEQTQARLALQAELAIAREAVQAAQAQLALQSERAALLRQRATLLDQSFRAGETALPDLLLAAQAATQADAALARQQAAQGLARARLLQASGVLP